MARTDERFRATFNALLRECSALKPGDLLASELALAAQFDVSRTVIRSILERLDMIGVVQWRGRQKALMRTPRPDEWLTVSASQVSPEELERQFLYWILRFDVPPGTPLNVAELARRFRVSVHGLQEFLASLSRFGLVKRRPKNGWELVGFTSDFAIELSDFRMMIELNAISQLIALPDNHRIWHKIEELEEAHRALAAAIDERFHDFSLLDERFHLAIGSVTRNRFVAEFQKVISLIFHYHYQWDKKDERERNAAAIDEHLRLIAALKSRDETSALAAARDHLRTSKQTLLSSLRIHALS
jgi:DNA-binding GntR family transcriptional regulator